MNTTILFHKYAVFSLLKAVLKDRVFQAMMLIIVLLVLFDASQLLKSIEFTLQAQWAILPFFMLAVVLAAYAKASGADRLIAKAFGGNPLRAIVLAALVGSISPFCSCGVIPLIAAMLGAGVPLAPVMAFWISSPIMDPEMFVLTAAGIGLHFAIAKTLVAIVMGLFSGFAVYIIQYYGWLGSPLRQNSTGQCQKSCGSVEDNTVLWKFWSQSNRVTVFNAEAISIGTFLGKWLTLAFFLESLMVAYVPSTWVITYMGSDNAWAIPLAAFIGAPSYLNGYAAIPLISGLIDMGMNPGAAMAFMTAGAVSSIPAAIAVWALVKKSAFILYLTLGLLGSMITAWLYQLSGGVI